MTRRELLDAKLKREAEEFAYKHWPDDKDWPLRSGAIAGYIESAASIAPMLLELAEALQRYEKVLRKYGCTPAGAHDDPSWCDESCNDYGKQARIVLAELDKFLGEE